MLIEVWICVEAENVCFPLSLVDFRLKLEANVNLSEAAFLKWAEIVSFD